MRSMEKTRLFMDFVMDADLNLVNTCHGEKGSEYTCMYPSRAPRQIDYVGALQTMKERAYSWIPDLTATDSDHRPVGLQVLGKSRPRRRGRKMDGKPIGWNMVDDSYLEEVGRRIGLPAAEPETTREDPEGAWHAWRDGGAKSHRDNALRTRFVVAAGWGFCLYRRGIQTLGEQDLPVHAARGR